MPGEAEGGETRDERRGFAVKQSLIEADVSLSLHFSLRHWLHMIHCLLKFIIPTRVIRRNSSFNIGASPTAINTAGFDCRETNYHGNNGAEKKKSGKGDGFWKGRVLK